MAYERVNWENLPSTKTPVNADNLNKMDKGIANAVEKKIKYGSVENPDSSKFQITYSRIVQVDNTVYVDIRIKILTEIPANQQYNFEISGVTPPESAIYPLASYGVNEYNFRTVIYCYLGKGPCVLNNPGMNSAVDGIWKVHFSYNVD